MIQITPQMRILVAVAPADFRKGIDGLARLCKEQLERDPFCGWMFVFRVLPASDGGEGAGLRWTRLLAVPQTFVQRAPRCGCPGTTAKPGSTPSRPQPSSADPPMANRIGPSPPRRISRADNNFARVPKGHGSSTPVLTRRAAATCSSRRGAALAGGDVASCSPTTPRPPPPRAVRRERLQSDRESIGHMPCVRHCG